MDKHVRNSVSKKGSIKTGEATSCKVATSSQTSRRKFKLQSSRASLAKKVGRRYYKSAFNPVETIRSTPHRLNQPRQTDNESRFVTLHYHKQIILASTKDMPDIYVHLFSDKANGIVFGNLELADRQVGIVKLLHDEVLPHYEQAGMKVNMIIADHSNTSHVDVVNGLKQLVMLNGIALKYVSPRQPCKLSLDNYVRGIVDGVRGDVIRADSKKYLSLMPLLFKLWLEFSIGEHRGQSNANYASTLQ